MEYCIICGHAISDTNIDGVGCECRKALRLAKLQSMDDVVSLRYNWIIKVTHYRNAFIESFKDTKFRSEFKKSFYYSICNNERVSRKQLDIISDMLIEKGIDLDCIESDIYRDKENLLSTITVTREHIEKARKLVRV